MTFNKNLLLIALTLFVGGFAYGAMPKQDYAAFEQALVEYSDVSVRSIQAAKPNAKLLERYRNAVTTIYNNLNMGDQIMALTAIQDSGFDPKEFGIGVKAVGVQLRKKSPQEPHSTPMATKKPQRKVTAAPAAKPTVIPAKTKPVKAAAPKTKAPFSAPKTPVALKKPVTAPKQAPALKQPAAPKAKVMPQAAKTAPVKTVVRAPVKKEADVLARYIPDAGIRNALKKQGLEQIYVDLIMQQKKALSDDKAIKALVDMNLRNDGFTGQANACAAAAPAQGKPVDRPKKEELPRRRGEMHANQKVVSEIVMLNAREQGDGKHTWDCSWEILNNAFAIADALNKTNTINLDISKVPYQNWVPLGGFHNIDSAEMEKLIGERNLFAPKSYTFLEGDPKVITAEILEALGTDIKAIKEIKNMKNAIHIFFVNKAAHWITVIVYKNGNKITYYIADDIRSKRKQAINAGVVSMNDLQKSDYQDVIALIRNLIEK